MLTPTEIEEIAKAVVRQLQQSLNSEPTEDSLLNKRQAACLIGCSVPTIERLTRSGELPSLMFGRLRRYRRADLLSASKSMEVHDA